MSSEIKLQSNNLRPSSSLTDSSVKSIFSIALLSFIFKVTSKLSNKTASVCVPVTTGFSESCGTTTSSSSCSTATTLIVTFSSADKFPLLSFANPLVTISVYSPASSKDTLHVAAFFETSFTVISL